MTNELMQLIEARSIPVPFSGCWIWTGATDKRGYGRLTYHGKWISAHRASFIASNQGTSAPAMVCHHCDIPSCVNPSHLYAGDYMTNRDDMLKRGRWSHPWSKRTHCAHGHQYSVTGFSIVKDGSRVCRECMRISDRNFKKRTRT